MRIDVSNGTVLFERGTISPKSPRPSLLDDASALTMKESFVNGNWRHYEFDPETGIAGTVIFEGDSIDRIFLSIKRPDKNAESWSVELELDRKKTHDLWLLAELGDPPYEYAWGRIVSAFDPKGLASEIIVVYES